MVRTKVSSGVVRLCAAMACMPGCGAPSNAPKTNQPSHTEPSVTGANDVSTVARNVPAPIARLSVPEGLLVAHALGSIDGKTYSNSIEALRCNHARGFRWFEVDLSLTADGELFCFHPGMEEVAGLARPVHELSSQEIEQGKYAGLYSIPRFSTLLAETERLTDVVLVTDTKGWQPPMMEAIKRAFATLPKLRATQVVLQSYGAQDIGAVHQLSREIDAGVLLTLYTSDADDIKVEALAKQYGILAVVADVRRFTPWLAQRIAALDLPILVHTINDHREILALARAGARGFYTDSYRPYGAALRDPKTAATCDASDEEARAFANWKQRDVLRAGDYSMRPCAQRTGAVIQLFGCEQGPSLYGPYLAVPPNHDVRVALDIAAGPEGANLWFEVTEKNRAGALRARDPLSLAPNERRAIHLELHLPNGSPGIETRLGVKSAQDRVLINGLTVSHGPSLDATPQSALPSRND